jgi:ABC-type nitrate/sulfonate/bicarbonate transport system substrate-binding protein
MRKRILILILILNITHIFAMEKIDIVLDWTPNTNHTGIYVAKELGYFKEEGIEVEILQPSNGSSTQLIAMGRADFGVTYQEDITFARLEGLPIVSLGAIIQHNSSGFASLKEKGIKTPADFKGKNYGGWGSPVEIAILKELIEKDGGKIEDINILTTGSVDFLKSSDYIDFAWVFEGWTLIEAKHQGKELNYISLREYSEDLDYYTPVFAGGEKIIEENPELVKKVMKAIKKGYEYSVENPEKAGKILLKEVPELNRKLVIESQRYLSSKYIDDAPYWGYQKLEVWERYQEWLYKNKLIDSRTDMKKAFTNEFLKD